MGTSEEDTSITSSSDDIPGVLSDDYWDTSAYGNSSAAAAYDNSQAVVADWDSWDDWMGDPMPTTGGAQTHLNPLMGMPRGSVCGTPRYTAPEALYSANPPGGPADVYGVGVLLLELLAGPHAVESGAPQQDAMGALALVEHCSPLAQDLVKGLLEPDPGARLTAQGALDHPWFAVVAESCRVGD